MSIIDDFKKEAELRRLFWGNAQNVNKENSLKGRIRKLDIQLGQKLHSGANVEIYKPKDLDRIYDRQDLCVKLFTNSKEIWGNPSSEGASPIYESTVAQNLMAIRGLAPRVYDIVSIRGKTAQITDYLSGHNKVIEIRDERFVFNNDEIKKDYNFVAGKLVDFQAVIFKDKAGYKRRILKKAFCVTQWPQGQEGLYQSLDYYKGKRDTMDRLKLYNLKNFKDKRVLDIGCNLGAFCREAVKLGAKRVIGLDAPDVIEVTKELAILDGYFNIDFYGLDLKGVEWREIVSITKLKRFDIFLFFAMEMWVGYPEWLNKCKTLYYEGHGVEREFRVNHF